MTEPLPADPTAPADGVDLRARRAAVRARWAVLSAAAMPDVAALHVLLAELVALRAAALRPPWQALSRAPAGFLDCALIDADADGRPEAFLLTRGGTIEVRRREGSRWTRLAQAALPGDAAPVRGFELAMALQSGAEAIQVVSGTGQDEDELYEINLQPPAQLVARRVLPDARRPAITHLALSRRGGPPALEGLLDAQAIGGEGDTLRVAPLLGQPLHIPLDRRPTALAYSAVALYLANSHESVERWLWHDRTLSHDTAWSLRVDGQITALALCMEAPVPLLLVATDERRLLIVDDTGRLHARYELDTVLQALAPDPEQGRLLAITEEGQARCYELALTEDPGPGLRDVAAGLPADARQALLARWLSSADPAETEAAVHLLLAESDSQALSRALTQVNGRWTAALRLLDALEPAVLTTRRASDPLLKETMFLAEQWSDLHAPDLRQRINRFTARLAARFPKQMGDVKAWRRLDAQRRHDDPTRAEALVQFGREQGDAEALRAGLNTYARGLLQRRQERWVFAARHAVRAILPGPGPSAALLATREGRLFRLDLQRSEVVDLVQLPDEALPRALTGGALATQVPGALLLTARGDMWQLSEDAGWETMLDLPEMGEAAAAVLRPRTETRQAMLFVGGRDGRIDSFQQEPAGEWVRRPPVHLPTVMIRTLALTAGEQPLLLAGGDDPGGQGTVQLLNLEGAPQITALSFDAGLRDARFLGYGKRREPLLAVLTANGYLHVVKANGARLWQYRVGRAARNLAVWDINGDGRPEIIVGGRHDTVLVFDASGAVQWQISGRAPVTYVAALSDDDGRPLLLTADLDNTLHVVEVAPPGSAGERALLEAADRALAALAALEGRTATDLVARWIMEAPTPYLRGYAFHLYGTRFHLQQAELRDHLLGVDVRDAPLVVQRAYAGALMRAAASAPPGTRLPEAVISRLRSVLAAEQVAAPALRTLLQTGRLQPDEFPAWSALLHSVARQPDADAQRAVLYALRQLRPISGENGTLLPAAWDILRAALATPSDAADWVARDAACLLRDLAGGSAQLWLAAHHVLAELPDSTLLLLLGQTNPRLLDTFPLASAVGALDRLHAAATPDAAARAFGEIAGSCVREFPWAAGTGDLPAEEETSGTALVRLYVALAEAAGCVDEGEWLRFVSSRRQPAGLDHVRRAMALIDAQGIPAGSALDPTLARIEEAVRAFLAVDPVQPDQLRRLVGRLRRDAELLVSLPAADATALVLRKALGGALWVWVGSGGVLTRWFETLTRPATPILEVVHARLQGTTIQLTATLRNPSQTEAIEELTIFTARTALRLGPLTFACRADTRYQGDVQRLGPQDAIQLGFQCPLTTEEAVAVRELHAGTGELSLPLQYFQPPRAWASPTLQATVAVRVAGAATVDWQYDLPAAWQRIAEALEQARALGRAHDTAAPLLLTCPPFARDSLLDQLQQTVGAGSRGPVIDLRQWLDSEPDRDRSDAAFDESRWLAWLAVQIWPSADPQLLQKVRSEGAPQHFFHLIAEKERGNRPGQIVLTYWEVLLFALARRDAAGWEQLDHSLPFLLDWAREEKIELVFVSTWLGELITRQRWPELHSRLSVVPTDRPVKSDDTLRRETVRLTERLLDVEALRPVLTYFTAPVDAAALVDLAGGYLHVLDLLILPALRVLQRDPDRFLSTAQDYFLEHATNNNFFNAIWLWQPFFERLALVLTANGELPLQDRTAAETGLKLGRDYLERDAAGRLLPAVVLSAGTLLTEREVVTIRSNRSFQPGDAAIRGLAPQGAGSPAWGAAGEMLLNLLRAGAGERLLNRLEGDGLLRRRQTRSLGDFYEGGFPLYDAWLRRSGILPQMLAAAGDPAAPWYPAQLGRDHRAPDAGLLFPARRPVPAYADIPLSDLPAIQRAVNSRTLPLFLSFYGLSAAARDDAPRRWQGLVDLAAAVQAWGRPGPGGGGDDAALSERLFERLGDLLQVGLAASAAPLPAPTGARLAVRPLTLGSLFAPARVKAFLLVVDDGAAPATQAALAAELRAWLDDQRSPEAPESGAQRVVLTVALRGAAALREPRLAAGADLPFIVIDLVQLIGLALQPRPDHALRDLVLAATGRSALSPYRPRDPLPGGSPLLVDRQAQLDAVLATLDSEDHWLLGSRGSGRTSLLREFGFRIGRLDSGSRGPAFFIRLDATSSVAAFYEQLRTQLDQQGFEPEALRLEAGPSEHFAELRDVLDALRAAHGHPVLLLVDDVDDLFLRDQAENGGRFFRFLRDEITGGQPRRATLIATGGAPLAADRRDPERALTALGRVHHLGRITPPGAAHLLAPLAELDVELTQPGDVAKLIVRESGGLPALVQLSGDLLLALADRSGQARLEPEEAEALLRRELRPRLKAALWDNLRVDAPPWAVAEIPAPNVKARLLVAAMMTAFEQEATDGVGGHPFTAAGATAALRARAGAVVPAIWPAPEEEIERLLVALTANPIVAPVLEGETGYRFTGLLATLDVDWEAELAALTASIS